MSDNEMTTADVEQFRAELAELPDYVLLDTAEELEPMAKHDPSVRAVWAVICNQLVVRHALDRAAIMQQRPHITAAIRAEIKATNLLRAATN